MKREKMLCKQCLYIFVVLFCATAVALLPRLANFSPCDPLICFSPTLYAHSLLKIEFFFECSWVLFEKGTEKEIFSLAKEVSKQGSGSFGSAVTNISGSTGYLTSETN